MKRIYIILLAGILGPGIAGAQQAPAGSTEFTLEQCIQYAMENSVNMQNAVLDQEIAAAKVKETVGIGLPQINGQASSTYNNQLQRFFALKSVAGGFSPQVGAATPGVGPNDVIALQQFFQLKASAFAAVTANQLLFNGSYLVGLKASKTYKELAANNRLLTKEQVIVQVTKAYYLALINRFRIRLFDNNISRVDSLLKNTRALNANGFAESIDVDRIEVSLNNLTTQRDQFARLQVLSLEALKFQMNYPMDQAFDIAGEISTLEVNVNLDDYLKDWDYKNRPDYQVLETNRRLQALNIKNRIASGMPVLTANGTLGYSTQSATIGGLFKTQTNLTEANGIGPDKYYQYSFIGMNLSIPLFSGLQRTYQVQQERLSLRKIENNFKSLKSNVDLQIKQSVTTYQNNVQALESQKRNMNLASNVARVTKVKYEQGVGSNLEVVDAENSLKESQINYYNALYDLLVAKVDMDKAFGVLVNAKPNESTK